MPDFSELWLNEELSDIVLLLKTHRAAAADAAGASDAADEPPVRKKQRQEQEEEAPQEEVLAPQEEEAPQEEVLAPQEEEAPQEEVVLARIPTHKIIIAQSPYFKAQIQRWQEQQPEQDAGSSGSNSTMTVSLVLDSAEQQPAAMSLLASLYGRRAAASTQVTLTDVMLLHKIILADMLQTGTAGADDVAQQAVRALCSVVAETGGMSDALQQLLLRLQTWPASLIAGFRELTQHTPLPVLTKLWVTAAELSSDAPLTAVLAAPHWRYIHGRLAALHDLHAVWVDRELRSQLWLLPLPAMQLLLSSKDLKVPSEDLVLYTARRSVSRRAA